MNSSRIIYQARVNSYSIKANTTHGLRPVLAQAGGDQPSEKLDPLVVSDGSHFEPKDYYPNFSWDKTPMYFMFGDT